MTKAEYQEYLNSEHWKRMRKECFARYGTKCAVCKNPSVPVDVHHLNYRNILDVKVSDLRPLCRRCHEAMHESLATHPMTRRWRRCKTGYSKFKKLRRQFRHKMMTGQM